MSWLGAKPALGNAVFRFGKIRRIHIIGCSRSGTTMLHLAMSYFGNIVLSPAETGVEAPYLMDRIKIVRDAFSIGLPATYVTKRNYGWFDQENVSRLIEKVRKENIGLINIVRDPRDVMSSIHAAASQTKSYVTPGHWMRSIQAADQIFAELADYPKKIEIRYEDVVADPDSTAQRIGTIFSLVPADPSRSFAMIKENLKNNRSDLHPNMLMAVHKLRGLDAKSVGRWKQNAAFVESDAYRFINSADCNVYLSRYGYEKAPKTQ